MSRLSNGTMGRLFQSVWCDNCQNDHGFSHTGAWVAEEGCEVLLRAVQNEDIPEWTDENEDGPWDPALFKCRMFTPCQKCDPGGDDEKPAPFDPGPDHGVLFEVVDQTPFTPMVIIPKHDHEEVVA